MAASHWGEAYPIDLMGMATRSSIYPSSSSNHDIYRVIRRPSATLLLNVGHHQRRQDQRRALPLPVDMTVHRPRITTTRIRARRGPKWTRRRVVHGRLRMRVGRVRGRVRLIRVRVVRVRRGRVDRRHAERDAERMGEVVVVLRLLLLLLHLMRCVELLLPRAVDQRRERGLAPIHRPGTATPAVRRTCSVRWRRRDVPIHSHSHSHPERRLPVVAEALLKLLLRLSSPDGPCILLLLWREVRGAAGGGLKGLLAAVRVLILLLLSSLAVRHGAGRARGCQQSSRSVHVPRRW